MKKLIDILYKVSCTSISGCTDIGIEKITQDSRAVKENTMFVAVRGTQVDGHNFIADAVNAGAKAVVCEQLPADMTPHITYVLVKDSKEALGVMASNIFDNPSQKLELIGVTGTNGKTTIVTLLYNLFTELGEKCGLISTINIAIGDEQQEATHTTPDAVTLNSILNEMVDKGITHCFMEVSSHAVEQKRVSGLVFKGGVFTNITHDHLDYHKTFANYLNAKKSFFNSLPAGAFALSNSDDANGAFMLQNTEAQKVFYAIKKMADYKCKIIENGFHGLNLSIKNHNVWFKLIGSFNAYNLLAVFAVASLLKQNELDALSVMSRLNAAEGRFQYIAGNNGSTAIVDYAHTPDALKNVLDTIKDIRTGNERVITVAGCGGNRDKTKRPLMAKIAAESSDTAIFTSDNPRHENPDDIIDEMYKELDPVLRKKTICITNRREAIKAACNMSQKGDIILVAGKGHEKYQEINGVKHHFDDMEEVKTFLI